MNYHKNGLYDPNFEHDACGVGLAANITGDRTHQIVNNGLEILDNLAHRGACGCDPLTGDGAGILIQKPHDFFVKECKKYNIDLPEADKYGVGMVFLPPKPEDQALCIKLIEDIITEEGQYLIGWRDVPINDSEIGYIARNSQPSIKQVFIRRSDNITNETDLERKLYIIRKVIENRSADLSEEVQSHLYIASLSSNRIVYKGLLVSTQLRGFYPDLSDLAITSAFAIVHSRFSTNTMGSWRLAHPYRLVCHNGEINTVRGNINWMTARESMFSSEFFGDDINKLFPIITPGASDTASFDNTLELLLATGRSLPHALMMMIPEATGENVEMPIEKKHFYDYHSCLMEPWDGPALIAATDGTSIGVVLDRNGLRPFRYVVTKDNLLVMASEVGVLDIPPEDIVIKDRIRPGRMFLLDTKEARIIEDEELKTTLANKQPYGTWLKANSLNIEDLPDITTTTSKSKDLNALQKTFGYTLEDMQIILDPMALNGSEPIGSMGNDTPLAVLSDKTQLMFNYFKQLFAQVSNPPLDAIREELVTSLESFIGSEQNLFEETPEHCKQLRLHQPILTNDELNKIKHMPDNLMKVSTCSTLFDTTSGSGSLEIAVKQLCDDASDAVDAGNTIIILSDLGVNDRFAPIPSLLATSAVHHHLIRQGKRTKVGLVVESGEPREVMHFALLIGYGAGAINPYLALDTLDENISDGTLLGAVDVYTGQKNFIKAIGKGVLKIMSKMGISTVQSYRGAQIFEAIGLNQNLIDKYFTWTPSRVGGIDISHVEIDSRLRHESAYIHSPVLGTLELDQGGIYQWRRDGEYHMYNPESISLLQQSTRTNDYDTYRKFATAIDQQDRQAKTLRGLMEFKSDTEPISIDEVEPVSEIVKRFATGAISLGAISREAHETLAIAANRIGAKSNTGEGGEDPVRFTLDSNGDSRNSAIKQVASGRFGVTTNYLVNATDLQIKMAQGSKPGEGGQLPGHKVDEYIGKIRHTTPGVELISPPPHHDIYSIEDLAQLIHDLKNVNPKARIHVKLVAEVGVGTIAAGVSKGHADVVLISGDSGGTGASPESSVKHAGLPWELGLAETQQVLLMNDLRGRIVVQTDGQLKTGRDVAIACLLGAEEFGFATGPLVTLGCIMLRKCHLNTCSVGIATQDPELRKKFAGKPEYVINYFYFIAEHLREIMAKLGFKTVNEMVGRMDMLEPNMAVEHWKEKGLDLSPMLTLPDVPQGTSRFCNSEQDHGLENALDHKLLSLSETAIENSSPVTIDLPINNSNRVVGAMLSGRIAEKHGDEGLPEDTITCIFRGSAGQSFGAFLTTGVTLNLLGDANDYFAKGMSGGRIVLRPPQESSFTPEETTIVGNVVLYGATGGKVFINGLAGERFGVRNSGASVVVEGVGDHCCEYMTGGTVVVLGDTGRNFAAGMSGGISYVFDESGDFESRCNLDMVGLENLAAEDEIILKKLIQEHKDYTDSANAKSILASWNKMKDKFVKIIPNDYKRVLEERKAEGQVSIG